MMKRIFTALTFWLNEQTVKIKKITTEFLKELDEKKLQRFFREVLGDDYQEIDRQGLEDQLRFLTFGIGITIEEGLAEKVVDEVLEGLEPESTKKFNLAKFVEIGKNHVRKVRDDPLFKLFYYGALGPRSYSV